ncbi:S-adenosyl-L-methionine-dependent methyltransferase [Kockiozyma suomiensis]|uniref:S-adenosyl-L-methionine-dependent methyltransferase n=1 Tax=Kockiozyma suomiensis TaxID=1337062 RepID=UPI003343A346
MFPTPSTSHADYDKVYEPSEDTFLFLDLLQEELPFLQRRFSDLSILGSPLVLELGSGSGVVVTFFHNHILPDALFLGTDINPEACKTALETSKVNNGTRYFDVLRTNICDSLRPNSIDVLLFNPPYVPADTLGSYESSVKSGDWLDFALLGGEDGMRITNVVLDQLDNIMSRERGVAYILFCFRNKPDEVSQAMRAKGWTVTKIGERKVRWEILSILRFEKE